MGKSKIAPFHLLDAVLAWVLVMAQCLSQVGILSERLAGFSLFLAWRLPSSFPAVCPNEVQVPAKIKLFPSGTLS